MARTADRQGRLAELVDAGMRTFAVKGYRATQMADVAQAMGVSPGLLYTYVDSKEALFHLVIDRALDPDPPAPVDLPVSAPPFAETVARTRERIGEAAAFPVLAAAVRSRRVVDIEAEVAAVVGELYDVTYLTRLMADVIERSAWEVPQLAQVFFVEVRQPLFDQLERWIVKRVRSGHFAPVPDDRAAVRMIIEPITWFARHRFDDRKPDSGLDLERTRETVIAMLTRALVAT